MEQVTINDGIEGKFISATEYYHQPEEKEASAWLADIVEVSIKTAMPQRHIVATMRGKVTAAQLVPLDACVLPASALPEILEDRSIVSDDIAHACLEVLLARRQ